VQRCDSAANGVSIEPSIPEPVRHTDARGLPQSGAGQDDGGAPGEVADPGGHLVGWDAHGPPERFAPVVMAAHVDQECSSGHELASGVGFQAQL
jgi:hypothetical protein